MNALLVEPEDRAQRLYQTGLSEAGDAYQQRMPAAQQRDQGLLDHLALPKDDLADTFANEAEAPPQRFDLGNEIGGGGVDGCSGSQRNQSLFKL